MIWDTAVEFTHPCGNMLWKKTVRRKIEIYDGITQSWYFISQPLSSPNLGHCETYTPEYLACQEVEGIGTVAEALNQQLVIELRRAYLANAIGR